MSCRGLDRFAAYEANHSQALFKQQMIANSDVAVLMADHSKFNTSHYFKLSNYNAIDYIVTNQAPVESFQDTVWRSMRNSLVKISNKEKHMKLFENFKKELALC